jgi:hypothetical protein
VCVLVCRSDAYYCTCRIRTHGELHDEYHGEHGPNGRVPESVEQRRDVVDDGHQVEGQPDLERVRHPPRVVPRDLGELPGEPEDRAPGLVDRRADPLQAASEESAVVVLAAAIAGALVGLRFHGSSSIYTEV